MTEDAVRKPEGHIVTFYSFKGGTGRTMALANVAWILASNGKRVLAVDWDLESPGLHAYFQPFLDDKRLARSRGVIDLIQDFAQAIVGEDEQADNLHTCAWYANVERQAVSLRWRFPGDGVLDLLPAGQQDETYSTRVNMFDWASFYERLNGDAFLEALRVDMRLRYDYILIDSRTGLSDTAGTCTITMPDTVVECFTLNAQSIEGAAAVARSIDQQRRQKPVRILPVPMKVENAEQTKLETSRDLARRQLGRFLRMTAEEELAHWGEVEIPYKPFFAYEEILAVFGERPHQQGSLLSAYERLTKAITGGAVTSYLALDEPKRRLWLSAFEWQKDAPGVPVVVSYASTDRIWADWVATVLRALGHSVTLEEVGRTPDEQEPRTGTPAGADLRTVVIGSEAFWQSPDAARFWRLNTQRDPVGHNRVLVRIDASAVPCAPLAARQVDASTGAKNMTRQALLAAFDHPPILFDRLDDRFPTGVPELSNLPERNLEFTDRAGFLEALRDSLSGSATAAGAQALLGLGGVGKTQIALEYAHRFAADYDLVWWVSAEQPDLVRAALIGLGAGLDLPAEEDMEAAITAVLKALRHETAVKRWLLVFDNADSPEALVPWIPQGGHIIVTSRNADWARHVRSIDVGMFTRSESLALLAGRVPGLGRQDTDTLAEKLGDLPLAVAQAATWLQSTATPITRYLSLLDSRLTDVLEKARPPWQPSLERLRTDSPAAARLLEVLAFFGPEPIPAEWIYSGRLAEFLRQDGLDVDELTIGELIREASRYSLIKSDSHRATVEMHRLVQAVLRAGLPPAQWSANRAVVHAVLVAADPNDPDDAHQWPVYRQLRGHVEAPETLQSNDDSVRMLVVNIVRFLWKIGEHHASRDLAERALVAWRANVGDDDAISQLIRDN